MHDIQIASTITNKHSLVQLKTTIAKRMINNHFETFQMRVLAAMSCLDFTALALNLLISALSPSQVMAFFDGSPAL
jgi:hypothetical protein